MLRRFGFIGAVLLLGVFLTELAVSVHRQSLSWDEGDHIFAGYQSWKAGDFGLNPEHPPLVKELATVPLLWMHLQTPPSKHLAFFKDEAYFGGSDLLFKNGGPARAASILFRARMAAALLSLLLGALVYVAGREVFGEAAALFALALLVFEPNMVAHGAYVTTDMGVSCFLFASIYTLYRYRARPSWQRLGVFGVTIGLTLATKHSAILIVPMLLTLLAVELILPRLESPLLDPFQPRDSRVAIFRSYATAFASAAVLGSPVLWATYGFRFSAHPGGVGMTPSLAEYIKPLHGVEPRVYLLLAKLHVLPESYIYGLADVRLVSNFFPTYIFGQIHAHGVPYYFPAAFVIKSTLGFMLLMLIAGFALGSGRLRLSRAVVFLLVPPLVYLLIAIGTGLNIGARHILPMYAFLAVLIGGAVSALAAQPKAAKGRRWALTAALLLGWHIVSSLRAFPVTIAYANELWGGPANTYKYLSDSNTDWAQQLVSVKRYLDGRGVKECWFAYFAEPAIPFSAYGIPCKPLPTQDSIWSHVQVDSPARIKGPVLVSVGTLSGFEFGSKVLSPYQPYTQLRPSAVIDHGVFVFDGTFDNHFAQALGHVTRAMELGLHHDPTGALPEAQQAVALAPEQMQAQMVLGDTLVALGRKPEARVPYDRALALTSGMEPSAKAEWRAQIQAKLAAL